MNISTLKKLLALISCALPASAHAMQGISGKFDVGLGPIPLGKVVMTYSCEENTCRYESQVKGSFMWVDADINEQGAYRQLDNLVAPISTSYVEKIGSKHKEYTYDFSSMEIENGRTKKRVKLTENAYPYIPLLNQVALDIRYGGPKGHYEYLSKHKVRRAIVTAYNKTPTENGTLHQVTTKRKDTLLEFFFVQEGDKISLEKLKYKGFKLLREK